MFKKLQGILERLHLTWEVLRGRIKVTGEGASCGLQHPAVGQVIVDQKDHEEYRKAAAELMFVRGFVAHVENKKYADAVKETIG